MLRMHTAFELSQELSITYIWGKIHYMPFPQKLPEKVWGDALAYGSGIED